jgi:hypothetical protein
MAFRAETGSSRLMNLKRYMRLPPGTTGVLANPEPELEWVRRIVK